MYETGIGRRHIRKDYPDSQLIAIMLCHLVAKCSAPPNIFLQLPQKRETVYKKKKEEETPGELWSGRTHFKL